MVCNDVLEYDLDTTNVGSVADTASRYDRRDSINKERVLRMHAKTNLVTQDVIRVYVAHPVSRLNTCEPTFTTDR